MAVINLNELPDDVLILIFRRFDLLERLKLRSVCLRWKWIIEHLRIRDVSVVDSQFNRRKLWIVIGLESLNCQNLIYYSEPQPTWYQRLTNLSRSKRPTGSFQLLSNNPIFSRLKSMFISLRLERLIENFCFEKYINPHFPHLEQLSCISMKLGKTSLSLPKLKVLSLFSLSLPPNTRIQLELPSMYKLLTNLRLCLFKFVYPQSITHLCARDDHESTVLFSNLEYFSCGDIIFNNESLIFSNLLKLKEIHLIFDECEQKRFDKIYQAKQRLNRCDVKIFIREVEYETYLLRPLSDLPFKDILGAYVSGKMQPSPVVPLKFLFVYDDLLDSQAIPSDLKSSFPFITKIKASRLRDDVASFFTFLGNYPNLHILELKYSFDGLADEQACYDSLPTCCKYLRKLKVHWSMDRTTPVDLDFVFGFRFLQELKIKQGVRSNFVQALFERLKYLNTFDF